MKHFIFTILVGAACVSCGNNAGNTGSSSDRQVNVSDSNAAFNTNAATNNVQGPASATNSTSLPAGNASTSGNTATAGVNPPHGQPGHRCEVAVGAPLNSAPATNKAVVPSINQPANITPPPASTTLPATGNTGTGRLNPPHGQPGHDCSVEVGKPLKQ